MSDRPQWMLELARFGIDGLTPEARLDRIVACYASEGARVQELEAQRLKLAKALLKYGNYIVNSLGG